MSCLSPACFYCHGMFPHLIQKVWVEGQSKTVMEIQWQKKLRRNYLFICFLQGGGGGVKAVSIDFVKCLISSLLFCVPVERAAKRSPLYAPLRQDLDFFPSLFAGKRCWTACWERTHNPLRVFQPSTIRQRRRSCSEWAPPSPHAVCAWKHKLCDFQPASGMLWRISMAIRTGSSWLKLKSVRGVAFVFIVHDF